MSEETYKGKKIVIKLDGKIPKLIVDNENIQVSVDVEAKKFFAYSLLPYTTFDSLKELAEALIDRKTE